MLSARIYARGMGITLLIAGVYGLLATGIGDVVRIDIAAAVDIMVLGAVGIYIGWYLDYTKNIWYAGIAGVLFLLYFAAGIAYPTFILGIRFEMAENIVNLLFGIVGVSIALTETQTEDEVDYKHQHAMMKTSD